MRRLILSLTALVLLSSPALAADFSIAQGDIIEIDLNSTGRFSRDVSFVVASPLKYSLNGTRLTVNASGRGLHSIAILASDEGSHSTLVFSIEVNLIELVDGENLILVSLSETGNFDFETEVGESFENESEEIVINRTTVSPSEIGGILNKKLGKMMIGSGFLVFSAALALKARNQSFLFMQ
jgi:hypothetical protein